MHIRIYSFMLILKEIKLVPSRDLPVKKLKKTDGSFPIKRVDSNTDGLLGSAPNSTELSFSKRVADASIAWLDMKHPLGSLSQKQSQGRNLFGPRVSVYGSSQ